MSDIDKRVELTLLLIRGIPKTSVRKRMTLSLAYSPDGVPI